MNVTVIGGGIIGLCTAYHLVNNGHEVTIIDKNDLTDNCSFGNLGYISPSHFVPLATPGIIKQGIKWMMDSSSPFYIQPRLNLDLIKWGFTFYKSANKQTVEKNMPHLNALIQLSRKLMVEMNTTLGNNFQFRESGCWMLYKNHHTGEHEKELAEVAAKYGLTTELYDANGVQQIENKTAVNVLGGVLYKDDAFVEPAELMQSLFYYLKEKKVQFVINCDINYFEKSNQKVNAVITNKGKFSFEQLVICNGSRMPELLKLLHHSLLMQGGKGYSYKYYGLSQNLTLPSILVDDRVATSPYGNDLRIGGTMEISGHNDKKLPKRIIAIYNAFKRYYPKMQVTAPDVEKTWFGYRPVTPDGMPYIGKLNNWSNVFVGGGHAMLGITAATGTGLLLTQLLENHSPSIEVQNFSIDRF